MRINSGKGAKVLLFFYLICILSLLFDFVILNVDGSLSGLTKISPIAMVILAFIWYRGLPEFKYDSDGEVLNFTTQDPNLIKISNRLFYQHSEFPKRKLRSFSINTLPFRRTLTIAVNSKDGGAKKEKFSVSYLSRKERKDLVHSLNKVMATNKTNANV